MADRTLAGVFGALSDPTRLAVIERLSRGPATVSELAEPFDMALPSFTQHLAVLRAAGLVKSKKAGRVRLCELAPRALGPARSWLDRRRDAWNRRLDQLDDYLLKLKEKRS